MNLEQLRAALDFNALTGEFTWRSPIGTRVRPGDAAGTANGNGYVRITVLGERHHAHRLAWFYVHGEWPRADIDHIDGCRSNNRLANLRQASRSENNLNLRGPKAGNRAGELGVSVTKSGTYFARLGRQYLGSFATPEEAAAAYRAAKGG